jgi:hypothetical protein
MKKYFSKSLLALVISIMACTLAGQPGHTHSGITIVSYILRDRAVIIDSLDMDIRYLYQLDNYSDELEGSSSRKLAGLHIQ